MEQEGYILELENQVKHLKREVDSLNRDLLFQEKLYDMHLALSKKINSDFKDSKEKESLDMSLTILPYIKQLKEKENRLEKDQKEILSAIENNLKPFIDYDVAKFEEVFNQYSLSFKEIKVVKLILQDKKTSEIAALLNLAFETISTHRKRIRTKFKIKGKKITIKQFLNKAFYNKN
ncbi:hypothetical protein GMMP15_1520027 [Candidatus Magnetomoraceae bacterium gMMP-15]